MKLQENKTYYLHENMTGEESLECRFSCLLGEREAEFFFAVKDDELVSPYERDNEDIWKGDAVEVFLSPRGDLTRYYELEVSPFGVRFWGEVCNKDGAGSALRLVKLAPPFTAETARTEGGYTVHIRLPLEALKGWDKSKMRLNAFRLDKRLSGEQRLYALNPTRRPTFHCTACLIGMDDVPKGNKSR